MTRFVTPIAALFLVLLAVSAVTFTIQSALPGNEAEVYVGRRDDLTTDQRNLLVKQEEHVLGLDKPLPVQFGSGSGTRLISISAPRSAASLFAPPSFAPSFPSLELALLTLLISLPTAVWLAVTSVRKGKRLFGVVADGLATAGFVMPTILARFPAGDSLRGAPPLAASGRIRLAASEPAAAPGTADHAGLHAFGTDGGALLPLRPPEPARGAHEPVRAYGASEGPLRTSVLYRHALPNALLPSLTVLGIQFGQLIGGVVIVEQVFNWPGIGGLLIYSVNNEDYNTLVGCVLAIAAAFVVFSTLVELTYRFVDPRIRRA